MPTEIKAHNHTTRHRYDDHVTIIPAASVLGEAVLGDAYTQASKRDKPYLMPAMLDTTRTLMQAEIATDASSPALNAATEKLYTPKTSKPF